MKKYIGFKKLGVAVLTAGILCGATPTFAASPVQYKMDSAKKENAQLNYIKKEGSNWKNQYSRSCIMTLLMYKNQRRN